MTKSKKIIYNGKMRELKKNIFPIVLFTFFILVFFGKLFFPQPKIFVTPDFGTSDLLHFYYPVKNFLGESLKHKELPLWSNGVGAGFPMYAEGQMGTFNLINLTLFTVFPTAIAFNLVYIISFSTIAFSTYFLALLLKFPRSVSLLIASMFTFSGFYVTHISHTSLLQAASFLPLELLLIELFLEKRQMIFLMFFSFILSQQIFCGSQQITFYSLIFSVFYFVFRLWLMKKEEEKLAKILRSFALFVFFLAFAFILSAVQILPSWELTDFSIRKGGLDPTTIYAYPYPIKHLLTFFYPFLFGNPKEGTYPIFSENWGIFWENTGYISLLGLLLAILGVVSVVKKNWYAIFFFLTLIFSLLLTLGKNAPLFFLFTLPPFSFFRVPSRFLLISDFALSFLAGFGALIFLNLKIIKKIKAKYYLPLTFTLIIVFDIFFFFFNYHPAASTKDWLTTPETAKFLKEDNSLYRIYTLGPRIAWNNTFLSKGWKDDLSYFLRLREDLDANLNLLYGIQSNNIHVTIPSRRYFLLQGLIENGISIDNEKASATISAKTKKLLNLQNVKYIISTFKIEDSSLPQKYKTNFNNQYPNHMIYENVDVLPRVFLVSKAIKVKSVEQLVRTIQSETFNPKEEVIIEKDVNLPGTKSDKSQKRGTTCKDNPIRNI